MTLKTTINIYLPEFLRPIIARVEASPLGYRLVRGAFWSLAGAIIARGLGMASSILVARMLGKTGFGELGIIQSTLGMFGTFAGFGLGMMATKFIAEYRTTDPVKAGRIRGLSSVFAWVTSGTTAFVLFLLAPLLAEHTLAAPQLTGLLKVGSLFLFLTAINGAQIGALSGFESFKTIAKISLWSGLVNFPLMVGGGYFAGLKGVVWGMIVATGINWLLNHIAIRNECKKANVPYSFEGCWTEKALLWTFALPAVISSVFLPPAEWALSALVVNQPGGYGEMGLFSAFKQWHALIIYLPCMLSSMTLPILSNLLGERKERQFKKVLYTNSALLTGCALIISVPVVLCSNLIVDSYGADFSNGRSVLLLIVAYSILWSSHIVVGQAMWSTGASSEAMIFAAVRALILVISGMYLVKYGAIGLASAFLFTYILQTLYLVPYVIYKINKYFRYNKFLSDQS